MVDALARAHAPEWNRLFPGAVAGAPDLSDLALSPSERRLHRESEQVFWILNFGAKAVLGALRATGKSLVVRNVGECDLVSLRALMRAEEWARLEGLEGRIELRDWAARRRCFAEGFEARRRQYLETLRARMRIGSADTAGVLGASRTLEAPVDLEGRYLLEVADESATPARRIAAAILAIRACFFSTNYEGATFAAETGLRQVDLAGAALRPEAVADAWDALDTGFTTPAIEVDKASLGSPEELRALFFRSLGVVGVFTGQHDEAMATFGKGLALKLPPEGYAHLHMFRALMLIKRLGQLPVARQEIESGLAHLAGRGTPFASLHEGWLRNVFALVHYSSKALEPALAEEKKAMACVGDLHDASATHLKINLISNVSVVQETAKRYADSITTWRRFEKISANWGVNFSKHHRYRLAGLLLLSGDKEQAVANYRSAYESAEQLGDGLHRQVIAAEQGRLALDEGRKEEAVRWYERATEHARDLGEPFALAESLAGRAIARGESDFSEALRCAAATSTFPDARTKLLAALEGKDPQAIAQVLPKPRTKLNRPFDLVNL